MLLMLLLLLLLLLFLSLLSPTIDAPPLKITLLSDTIVTGVAIVIVIVVAADQI